GHHSPSSPIGQAFERHVSPIQLRIAPSIPVSLPTQSRRRLKLLSRYEQDNTLFFSLMESDPTSGLLTFIGILTLFFALETMLVEQQFFRMLARLIGRRVGRLSTCGITAIVTRDGASRRAVSRGCGGSSYDKYQVSAERVNKGLVGVFDEKGRNIFIHHAEDGSGVGSAIIPTTTKIRKEAGLYANV
ncbi:hexokinase-1, partial [Mycena olivaceomarginata]